MPAVLHYAFDALCVACAVGAVIFARACRDGRDAAFRGEKRAQAEASACRAALSLNEAHSCKVCRAWRLLPDVAMRRAPPHIRAA